jgi:hypothetical protein
VKLESAFLAIIKKRHYAFLCHRFSMLALFAVLQVPLVF